MSVRLTVKQRSEQGGADKPSVVMLDDDIITLGRDQVCQVVLAQQAVSRNHARISRDGTLYFVEDLGSSYGTQINGQKLPKGEKHLLRNGDVIAIAQFDVTFDRVAAEAKGENGSGNTQFVARKLVKDAMRSEQPYFRIMNGPREGERIEIADAQEYIIGRDETADIILKDDLVSRKHVKVRRDWSGVHVEDLGSRNGIKINKKRNPGKTLQDRDEVEVGGVRLLFLDPNEVREAPVVLPNSEDEEGESTTMEKAEDEAADSGRKKKKKKDVGRVSKIETKAEEPPSEMAEPPPEEAPPPAEEAPPPEEPSDEPNTSQDPPMDEGGGEEPPPDDGGGELNPDGDGGEAGDGGDDDDGGGRRGGIDLTNRSTMIGVGIGAAALLIGIVVLILLVAGA